MNAGIAQEGSAQRIVTTPARTPKSERKRDEIITAATAIINARTYALATMTEIAAELELRDAALYYYFPSKQSLFYACNLRSTERFERFISLGEAEGTTGLEKLRRFLFHLIADSARDGPLLYFGDYFHLESDQRAVIRGRAEELTARLEAILTSGIEDRSIVPCDARLVVQLLLGMLIWLAKWTPAMKDLTVDQLFDAICGFSLRGLENEAARGPHEQVT